MIYITWAQKRMTRTSKYFSNDTKMQLGKVSSIKEDGANNWLTMKIKAVWTTRLPFNLSFSVSLLQKHFIRSNPKWHEENSVSQVHRLFHILNLFRLLCVVHRIAIKFEGLCAFPTLLDPRSVNSNSLDPLYSFSSLISVWLKIYNISKLFFCQNRGMLLCACHLVLDTRSASANQLILIDPRIIFCVYQWKLECRDAIQIPNATFPLTPDDHIAA